MTSAEAPKWVMPWIAPTGDVARQALAALDRPLLVVREPDNFDPDDAYEHGQRLSTLEREIRKLGVRSQWRLLERIWLPDEETSEAEQTAYDAACVTVAGFQIAPRCLDAYAEVAVQLAGIDQDDDPDEDPPDARDLAAGLAFAEAGVCVLQQSLPWPFLDVLPYGPIDNRPAHRILDTYATLLAYRKPRVAGRWFTAMTYLNPTDNMGARFRAPGGPRDLY